MTFRWLRSGNKEKQTSEWSTKDVQRFFREQDLEEVAVAAKKAKLGGKQLLLHEPGELYAMLGVTRLAQKKKLRSAFIHLRQQSLAEELAVSLTSSSSSSPPSSASSSSSFSASSSPSSSFSFLPTASKSSKAVFSQSDTTITKVSSSTWSPVVPSRRVRSGSGSDSSFGTPCASGESTPSSYHTPQSSPQSSPPSTPVRLRSLSDAADLAQRLDDVNNLSEAFAFLHRNSVIAVKASLRRRAIKSVVAYDEVDVSLLRLDVGGGSRQLRYADLVEEVARVHGSVAARKVKIRYTDGEGDEVTVLGDDALRYAFRDWRQRVQATPPGRLAPSWRLCLYLDEADEEDEGHHHTKTCK